MAKLAVVYYSATGNTQMMAEAVAEGARNAGAQVDLIEAGDFNVGSVVDYDSIAFGCSAYGVENLEEGTFEPMFAEVEGQLSGKKIGLFGSYDWGDGGWMREWQERVQNDGANLVQDGVIANLTPEEDALEACRQLGATLVK